MVKSPSPYTTGDNLASNPNNRLRRRHPAAAVDPSHSRERGFPSHRPPPERGRINTAPNQHGRGGRARHSSTFRRSMQARFSTSAEADNKFSKSVIPTQLRTSGLTGWQPPPTWLERSKWFRPDIGLQRDRESRHEPSSTLALASKLQAEASVQPPWHQRIRQKRFNSLASRPSTKMQIRLVCHAIHQRGSLCPTPPRLAPR